MYRELGLEVFQRRVPEENIVSACKTHWLSCFQLNLVLSKFRGILIGNLPFSIHQSHLVGKIFKSYQLLCLLKLWCTCEYFSLGRVTADEWVHFGDSHLFFWISLIFMMFMFAEIIHKVKQSKMNRRFFYGDCFSIQRLIPVCKTFP